MSKSDEVDPVAMFFVCVLIIFALTVGSFMFAGPPYNPENAQRVLTAAGYTDIKLHQPNISEAWGCHDEWHKVAFEANGPTGITANGIVCTGWLKDSTIRIR